VLRGRGALPQPRRLDVGAGPAIARRPRSASLSGLAACPIDEPP
jgi:hypothetical protein